MEESKDKSPKKSHGEGSIKFIEKLQKYEARFGCVDPSTGKFQRKCFYGITKAEALRQGRKWVSDIKDGSIQIGSEKIRLSEWVDLWLKDYAKPSVRDKLMRSMKVA